MADLMAALGVVAGLVTGFYACRFRGGLRSAGLWAIYVFLTVGTPLQCVLFPLSRGCG